MGRRHELDDLGIYYYSYEGFTDELMKALSRQLGQQVRVAPVHLERLMPEEERAREGFAKYFWGGRDAIMQRKPVLKPLARDPGEFRVIVIAAPIWAFTSPPPIGSFLAGRTFRGQSLVLVLTHEGGPRRAMERLKSRIGDADVIGEYLVFNPGGEPDHSALVPPELVAQLARGEGSGDRP